MTARANYFALAPQAMRILREQEDYLNEQFSSYETVDKSLLELVKLRVSQINQCAFCIDMHSKIALKLGEQADRIIGLSAWRDMPNFTDTECAALNWAEKVTAGKAICDKSYQSAVSSLGEQVVVNLTIAIIAINSWNRIAKTFKPEVGSYSA